MSSLATLNNSNTNYNQFVSFGTGAFATYGNRFTTISSNGLNEFSSHGKLAIGTDDSNPLYFGTNNAVRAIIDSAGNVGIGTTTPFTLLNIASTNPKFTISDIDAATNYKHWFINSSNGDFMVGTTSDSQALNGVAFQIASTSVISTNGKVISATLYPTFTYATSTAWTATTTIPLGVAVVGETWLNAYCYTDTGTVFVSFYDGTDRMNIVPVATAIASTTLSTNNIFNAGDKRYVDIGTPASTPTKVSCTISKFINP
jgi:hypothetical protein